MKYILIFVIFLTSCSSEKLIESIVPKDKSAKALSLLDEVRNGEYQRVKSHAAQEISAQLTDELLIKLTDYFYPGTPISTKIIGFESNSSNNIWQGNFTYEFEFLDGWNQANLAFREVSDKFEIIGINVYRSDQSIFVSNAFSFSNKRIDQYLVIIFVVAIPIFCIVTLFVCIRTPISKNKWLWVIGILMGFGTLSVEWTTGTYSFQPVSLRLLGASASRVGIYGPWILSVSIPVVAIIFWFKRKGLSHQDSPTES